MLFRRLAGSAGKEESCTLPNTHVLSSLRARFVGLAGLLTLIIVSAAWGLHQHAYQQGKAHADELEQRHQATLELQALQRALLKLDSYHTELNPASGEQQTAFSNHLDSLQTRLLTLSANPWLSQWTNSSDTALLQALNQLGDSPTTPVQRVQKGQYETFINQAWAHSRELERAIQASREKDSGFVHGMVGTISDTLYGLALLVIAMNLLAYWLLSRHVLSPVAKISSALKSGGHGDHPALLPSAATQETQELLDAFAEMRRQVDERQHALEHQALHDALTGLPNRILLHDRIEHLIHLSKQHHEQFALLVMDLDGFKEINDTLGHHIGDQLLKQVAERICRIVQDRGTVSRLGGDEFAILLEEAEATLARRVGEQLLNTFDSPFRIETHSLYISSSLGVAIYPNHATDAQCLIRRADVAMYVAKRDRNGIAIYDISQDKDSLERLETANELRRAIEHEELELYFQPQINLHNLQCIGFEVLLRWQHPRHGYIQPDIFIQVAEQTGIIGALTYWVIDKTLAQCAAWQHQGVPFGTLAVNLSAYNLQDRSLYRNVAQLLNKWGIAPGRLELEMTESAMMADPIQAMDTLNQLNAIGIKLAIDDYGTGFSSLSYLKQLPVNKIKIDKSFVMEMVENENDEVIVRSTIDLAHNLGMKIIAEGVEDQATLQLLKNLDCDMAQGYHISHPMPLEDTEQWIFQADMEDDECASG